MDKDETVQEELIEIDENQNLTAEDALKQLESVTEEVTAEVEEETEEEESEEETAEVETETEVEAEEDKEPTVMIGDTEIPISEVKAGYMKDSDYRKKTTELARQREALEEKMIQVAKLHEQVQSEAKTKSSATNPLPDDDLDPEEILRREVLDLKKEVQALKTEKPEWLKQEEDRIAKQREMEIAHEASQKELLRLIPEWKDDATYDRDVTKIRNYLMAQGIPEANFGVFNAPANIKVLHEMVNGSKEKAIPMKKGKGTLIESKQDMMPPSGNPTSTQSAVEKAYKRLENTGNPEHAVKYLELIENI